MINKKSKKRKVSVKIFHSFKEQEEADIKFWRSKTPNQKMKLYEEAFNNYLRLTYGKIPRLQRHVKIIERKES